jgi:hypothetical protein
MPLEYEYRAFEGYLVDEGMFAWIPPPPIAPPHHDYKDFVEERDRLGRVVMKEADGDVESQNFHVYYDWKNGRRLHFLDKVKPHVLVIRVEDFGIPVPFADFVDKGQPGVTLPDSIWMYLHDNPQQCKIGNRMEARYEKVSEFAIAANKQ